MEGDSIFKVPEVIDELTTCRVLTMELINGVPLDGCVDLDQETRNKVSPCGKSWSVIKCAYYVKPWFST